MDRMKLLEDEWEYKLEREVWTDKLKKELFRKNPFNYNRVYYIIKKITSICTLLEITQDKLLENPSEETTGSAQC